MPEPTFTEEQITTAARELREAAGADDAQGTGAEASGSFSLAETLRRLGPEVVLLRERGFSDDRIADLLTGFDIEVTGAQVASMAGTIEPRG